MTPGRPSQPNSHVQSTSRRREEQRSPFLDMNLQGALHKGILASGDPHRPSSHPPFPTHCHEVSAP